MGIYDFDNPNPGGPRDPYDYRIERSDLIDESPLDAFANLVHGEPIIEGEDSEPYIDALKIIPVLHPATQEERGQFIITVGFPFETHGDRVNQPCDIEDMADLSISWNSPSELYFDEGELKANIVVPVEYESVRYRIVDGHYVLAGYYSNEYDEAGYLLSSIRYERRTVHSNPDELINMQNALHSAQNFIETAKRVIWRRFS